MTEQQKFAQVQQRNCLSQGNGTEAYKTGRTHCGLPAAAYEAPLFAEQLATASQCWFISGIIQRPSLGTLSTEHVLADVKQSSWAKMVSW